MKKVQLLQASVFLLILTSTAQADMLRCGRTIVKTGDAKSTVLDQCGEPKYKDTFCKDGGSKEDCDKIEEWVLEPEYGKLTSTLRFENGRIVSITLGDR